ncbi:MAG: flippase-like domain-containing protein [Clostridiales bacterium]|nr:flippase-like domain-containing protein [Clostridiales bacterium]
MGIVVTAGINLLLVLLCTWEKFQTFSFYILEKISFKGEWKQKKETWKEQIGELFRESKSVMKNKKLVVRMLILNMVKIAVLYFIPWFSLMAVGEEGGCGPGKSFVLASLMILMTNAIPHIAGMGPAEFMFLFLYGFYTSEAGAASAMLLYRAATYFLPFGISMLVVFCGKRAEMAGRSRMKKEKSEAENKIKKFRVLLLIADMV